MRGRCGSPGRLRARPHAFVAKRVSGTTATTRFHTASAPATSEHDHDLSPKRRSVRRYGTPIRRRLMNVAKIPVACLLPVDERENRVSAWASLMRTTCRELTPTERGIEARFAPAAQAELERLVASERVCCGWAEWSVSVAEDEVVLTATAWNEPGPTCCDKSSGSDRDRRSGTGARTLAHPSVRNVARRTAGCRRGKTSRRDHSKAAPAYGRQPYLGPSASSARTCRGLARGDRAARDKRASPSSS
jgi:hypothetical protein